VEEKGSGLDEDKNGGDAPSPCRSSTAPTRASSCAGTCRRGIHGWRRTCVSEKARKAVCRRRSESERWDEGGVGEIEGERKRTDGTARAREVVGKRSTRAWRSTSRVEGKEWQENSVSSVVRPAAATGLDRDQKRGTDMVLCGGGWQVEVVGVGCLSSCG
jgi:hypothetical protein